MPFSGAAGCRPPPSRISPTALASRSGSSRARTFALHRDFGDLYFPLVFPAATYPAVDQPVPTPGVANVLVVNRSMAESLAYDITRVLFEKRSELVAIHHEARHLSLERAITGSPAAYHPGAERSYREKAVSLRAASFAPVLYCPDTIRTFVGGAGGVVVPVTVGPI